MNSSKFNELFFVAFFFVALDYAFLCMGLYRLFEAEWVRQIPYTFGYFLRLSLIVVLLINSNDKRNKRLLKKKRKVLFSKKTLVTVILTATFLFLFIPIVPVFRVYVYPSLVVLLVLSFTYFSHNYPKTKARKESDEEIKMLVEPNPVNTRNGLPLPVVGGGYVNIYNRNRHILGVGSTGSGKSYSIGYVALDFLFSNGIPGFYYDLKYPKLAEIIYTLWKKYSPKGELYIINLVDPKMSHTCNLFDPDGYEKYKDLEISVDNYFNNILPDRSKYSGSAKFFTDSAVSIFKSWALFTRNLYLREKKAGIENPKLYCTLPHILELCLYNDIASSVELLETDPEVFSIIQSIRDSVPENEKKKSFNEQLMGVLSSLKVNLPPYITKENYYIFGSQDPCFKFDLNNKNEPKHLIINSQQGSEQAYGPLATLAMSSALTAMMKTPDDELVPSANMMDEFQSVSFSNMNSVLQSCRSKEICMIALFTDVLDLYEKYQKDNANAIMGKFNNQFWGAANTPETAKRVIDLFGKMEKTVINRGQSSSSSNTNVNSGSNLSESTQLRDRVRSQDVINQNEGEFLGFVKGGEQPMFKCKFEGLDLETGREKLPIINEGLTEEYLEQNFIRIRNEARELIESLAPKSNPTKRKAIKF